MDDDSRVALRALIADGIRKAKTASRRKRRSKIIYRVPTWAQLLIAVLLAFVALVILIATDDRFIDAVRRGFARPDV